MSSHDLKELEADDEFEDNDEENDSKNKRTESSKRNPFFDLNDSNDNGQNLDNTLRKSPTDDVGYSIYNITNLRTLSDSKVHSSKSTLGSFCSYESNRSRRSRKSYNEDDDDIQGGLRGSANIYRQNSGGGGSFLANDFICRDILIMVKELLAPFTKSNTQITKELMARSTKLYQVVNETLWRFQLVKLEQISIDYGRISITPFDHNSVGAKNSKEELLVYEMMKNRRRFLSSASSNSETLTGKKRSETLNSNVSLKSQRRPINSVRSLSVVCNLNKPKKTNMTIMKLLADFETLASLCLKGKHFYFYSIDKRL